MSTFELPCPLPAGTNPIIAHLLKCIADNTDAANLSGNDYEGWQPFCDANGNITGFISVVYDEATGTQTELYRDSNFDETPTRPTGTPCVSSDDGVLKKLEVRCKLDDVDSNPENMVTFYEACYFEVVNGIPQNQTITTYSDACLETPYTVINEFDSSSGDSVTGVAPLYRVIENGASWNAPALAQCVTVTAVTVANPATPPTLETNAGTFPIFPNIPLEFCASDCSHMLRGTFTVRTNAGDVVAVTATELTTL